MTDAATLPGPASFAANDIVPGYNTCPALVRNVKLVVLAFCTVTEIWRVSEGKTEVPGTAKFEITPVVMPIVLPSVIGPFSK